MERAASCFSKSSLKRGSWSPDEDMLLKKYVETHGAGHWNTVTVKAGLRRSGKSCRLRWMNYLRPNVKLGHISADEEELIIRLHKLLGNRWSLIAGRVPGRTDNEVKNYWNSHLSKQLETRSKIPTRRRNFKGSQPLDSKDPEDPMTINSSDGNGNFNSRSADAASTKPPQLISPRDSNLAPIGSREKDYSGPDFLNFRPCNTSVMSTGLAEPSPLLTDDEFVSAKILSPVKDDQGVTTRGFGVESPPPCSDFIYSSPYSWVDIVPNWINCSVEIQDQWFPRPANEHIWPLTGGHDI